MLFGFSIWVIVIAVAIVALISFIYDIEWYRVAIVVIAILVVSGLYRDGKLPEKLEPIADKIFFWVDKEADSVKASKKPSDTEASEKQTSKKSKSVFSELKVSIASLLGKPVDKDRIYYNIGSSTTLRGDVGLAVIFLNDNESGWKPKDANKFMENNIMPGVTFMEKQADFYGADLSLRVTHFVSDDSFTFGLDGILDDLYKLDAIGEVVFDGSNMQIHWDMMNILAGQFGFETVADFRQSLCAQMNVDQVVPIIVANKPGWNYSIVDKNPDREQAEEVAFIYSLKTDGKPVHAKSVAKQWVETFGAENYTDDPEGRPNDKALAKRLFPYTLMLGNTGYDLDVSFLDGFTAYALGWIDELPVEYGERRTKPIQMEEGDLYRPHYDKGMCRDLSGTPYVLSIYIDDDESSWTLEQADKFQNNVVLPGLSIVNEQAAQWGVSLNLLSGMCVTDDSQGTSIRYKGSIPNMLGKEPSSPDDILDQVALSMGYASKSEMHLALQEHTGEEQIIYILMVNKKGRPHAYWDGDKDPGDGFEYCIVYSSWNGATKPDAVAHELLHLFGAEDLYREKYDDVGYHAAREAIVKKHWPKEIMLSNSNVVGDYTAYTVGWTNVCPEACMAQEFWEDDWPTED